MKLAIMQPYIFPYIGYYQLIRSVDKIVMYDDVNFIKQGWINRNRILLNGKDLLFSVPLSNPSSFGFIKDTLINKAIYDGWKGKFIKTLSQSYHKAPFFNDVCQLVVAILDGNYYSIADLACESLKVTSSFIGISTTFVNTSVMYHNQQLKSQDRVIDICIQEKATIYNNLEGGTHLYSKDIFKENNLALNFIKPCNLEYKQFNNPFVPCLSIIDVLMFNPIEDVSKFLNEYKLL